MNASYQQLLPLADALDKAYNKALDQLEETVLETVAINRHVREILDHDQVEVISVNTEGASSPREVFTAFADALAGKVLPMLSVASGKNGNRTRGLVDWSDAPPRANLSDHDYHLARIGHARSKRMRDFLKALVIRFNPTDLPAASLERAIQDLIQIFSVHTAIGVSMPVRRANAPAILRCPLQRVDDDAMWHLTAAHRAAIAKGANAMATVALLNGQHAIAGAIEEMLNAMEIRLDQTALRYEAGQLFHAAAFMQLSLERDGADFHLGNKLFELVHQALADNVPDLLLVYH